MKFNSFRRNINDGTCGGEAFLNRTTLKNGIAKVFLVKIITAMLKAIFMTIKPPLFYYREIAFEFRKDQ